MGIFRNVKMEKAVARHYMMLRPQFQVPELARNTARVLECHRRSLNCFGVVLLGTLGLMYMTDKKVESLENRINVLERVVEKEEENDNNEDD